jgi:hypothetical protein
LEIRKYTANNLWVVDPVGVAILEDRLFQERIPPVTIVDHVPKVEVSIRTPIVDVIRDDLRPWAESAAPVCDVVD